VSPYRTLALELPATRLVPPPTHSRRIAAVLSGLLAGMLALAALSPWRQSVQGTGRVIAYAPLERQQTIEAPIDARLTRFLVSEGQHVEEGELLVELTDNDPMLRDRLDAEREVTATRLSSYEDRVRVLAERQDAVARSQRSAVTASEARMRVASDRVEAAEQSLAAAEADLDAQVLNLARHRVLVDQGLVSQRELELAALAEARARTARDGARASRDAARGELEAARASLEQARATATAETENATATLRSAETDRDAAQAALLRIDSRVARQATQEVRAPRAGTVLRILGNAGGEQVRAGDALLALVPDTDLRAVELWVDGNDASLVSPGRVARLQFEGWPAVQFTGWPSVAIGTFAGHVSFVDSTDDGSGNFRVVIQPDPRGEPWPEARFLRQGVRVNGWVLLDEVRLGFELWRQLNGFPPALRNPPTTAPARESTPRTSRRAPSSRGSYGGGYGSSGGYGSYGGGYGSSGGYGGEGGYGEEGGGY
jgi:multidrug efflux pump subunit AcrA (membrane-fusion protein)